jgi:gluconolactonase
MALRNLVDVETIAGSFNSGLDHPEGITWGPDGYIYAGGEDGQIYQVNPTNGEFTEIASHHGFLGGVACDALANVYVCAPSSGSVVRTSTDGSVVEVTTGTIDRPMETPNYPCFHPSGALYISDSGEWGDGTGRIYRVSPEGTTDLVSEAPKFFANGMCFDANAKWLYVVESQLPGVSRLRVEADGILGERQVVATLPGDVPDGIQLDVSGNLFITLYAPSRVYQQQPDGRIEVFVDDPHHTQLASPTNIAFGGPSHTDLFLASLGRWHISRIRMETPGLALNYPTPIAL